MAVPLFQVPATLKFATRAWFITSVNDSVILSFREGFILTKNRIREVLQKQNARENVWILQYLNFVI